MTMLFRLAPLSSDVIIPVALRFLGWYDRDEYKQVVVAIASEITMFMTMDSALQLMDKVVQMGRTTFVAADENTPALFAVDYHKRTIFDQRERSVFGDNMTHCPGRFFIMQTWGMYPHLQAKPNEQQKEKMKQRRQAVMEAEGLPGVNLEAVAGGISVLAPPPQP